MIFKKKMGSRNAYCNMSGVLVVTFLVKKTFTDELTRVSIKDIFVSNSVVPARLGLKAVGKARLFAASAFQN